MPIYGFNGILWRAKCQDEQIKLHEALLDGVSEDISSMQRVQVATNVKLSELKQKTLELEHRVLKVNTTKPIFLKQFNNLCSTL